MALPSSGTLTLGQIKTEFGGATPPANLRAYLKGAGYVSSSDTAPSVPTSGTLTMRAFLGAAKVSGSALSASASASIVGGIGDGTSTQTVTSDPVTVTASGGTSPYTYSWVRQSGSTMSATAATSATTSFSRSLAVNGTASAVWRCTVTDAASATATVDVTADLSNPA